ncbi:unnamed protein product, partial [Brassica napus]
GIPCHKFEFCAVDTCPVLSKRSDSLTWKSDGLCLKIGLNRVAFSTIASFSIWFRKVKQKTIRFPIITLRPHLLERQL